MLLESRRQPQEELVAALTSGVKVGQTHTRCIKETQSAEREIAARGRFTRSLRKFASSSSSACMRVYAKQQPTYLSSSRGSRPCSPAVTAERSGRWGRRRPAGGSLGPETCGERT